MMLDKRVHPPRPLAPDGGWNANGGTGSFWGSGFDQLAKRYDWLRGRSEDRMFPYEIKPLGVVDAPAAKAGSVTAWFHQWGDGQLVLRDAKEEIVVGLLYVDRDGELRWARRIYG